MVDIAELFVRLGLRSEGLREGLADAKKDLGGMRGEVLELGKDWQKTARAAAFVAGPIIAGALALNKVTSDAAAAADRLANPESAAIAKQYADQLANVNAQLEAAYLEIGVKLIPVMQQLLPIITGTVIPAMEALANAVGVVANAYLMAAESADAFYAAASGDLSGAEKHLQAAYDAAGGVAENVGDLATGTSKAGLKSTAGTKTISNTADRNAAYMAARKSGTTIIQNNNIKTVSMSANQTETFIRGASRALVGPLAGVL